MGFRNEVSGLFDYHITKRKSNVCSYGLRLKIIYIYDTPGKIIFTFKLDTVRKRKSYFCEQVSPHYLICDDDYFYLF